MVRSRFCLAAVLVFASLAVADPVEQTLAIQKAMTTGRYLLEQNRPREAVEVLQKELLHADGNGKYLELLRDAYHARLKELQLLQANPEEAEAIRRQLSILGSGTKGEKRVAAQNPAPAKNAPPGSLVPEPVVPLPVEPKDEADPFQQVPLDRQAKAEPTPPSEASRSGGFRERALAAFEKKNYREANQLFKQVSATELQAEEKLAWGYSKLHEVSTMLNRTGDEPVPVAQLEAEVKLGMQLGGEKLQQWGKQVLGELGKRKPVANEPTALPDGWAVVESVNFRVIHKQMKDPAGEIARAAEVARSAMYERWAGPVAPNWTPKCDIWLHPDGTAYSTATGQLMTSPGHSSVELRGTRVSARRIDLRADVPGLIDSTLPHEVTYVLVQELFAEQPLPRWAEVAITVMSEPPGQVARYLRAVPRLAKEKRLLPVGKLLNTTDFPDEANATPFFVGSVSLVDYLIRLKGARAFALFLREAPRRGYEKALQTHYGFKDANDLQDKWLKFASGE